jgi:hypothetical protein
MFDYDSCNAPDVGDARCPPHAPATTEEPSTSVTHPGGDRNITAARPSLVGFLRKMIPAWMVFNAPASAPESEGEPEQERPVSWAQAPPSTGRAPRGEAPVAPAPMSSSRASSSPAVNEPAPTSSPPAPGVFGCARCLSTPSQLNGLALDCDEFLVERSNFHQRFCTCRHCGQVFLEDYRVTPRNWPTHAERMWLRWFPLPEHARRQVESRTGAGPALLGLLQKNPYLTLDAQYKFFWTNGHTTIDFTSTA